MVSAFMVGFHVCGPHPCTMLYPELWHLLPPLMEASHGLMWVTCKGPQNAEAVLSPLLKALQRLGAPYESSGDSSSRSHASRLWHNCASWTLQNSLACRQSWGRSLPRVPRCGTFSYEGRPHCLGLVGGSTRRCTNQVFVFAWGPFVNQAGSSSCAMR